MAKGFCITSKHDTYIWFHVRIMPRCTLTTLDNMQPVPRPGDMRTTGVTHTPHTTYLRHSRERMFPPLQLYSPVLYCAHLIVLLGVVVQRFALSHGVEAISKQPCFCTIEIDPRMGGSLVGNKETMYFVLLNRIERCY